MAKKKKENKIQFPERTKYYTIIIGADDHPDFEDYTDIEIARKRLKELREQGISAGMGWTNV